MTGIRALLYLALLSWTKSHCYKWLEWVHSCILPYYVKRGLTVTNNWNGFTLVSCPIMSNAASLCMLGTACPCVPNSRGEASGFAKAVDNLGWERNSRRELMIYVFGRPICHSIKVEVEHGSRKITGDYRPFSPAVHSLFVQLACQFVGCMNC